ncbi:uncharacterized protein PITG_16795 [Phytophthora infestans T30-4]|uniref:Uncharacterized protein n=1 Tax=Phytophthora infestans (strain T30-4) TaxID=403677 RepID=D0NUW2_PHYIT|nr:uncharacterized protein PITG_16795 [Phytophthora infestans T30-4]EEY65485.1 conserved hypothetical protein [Phytophthora infestans T30-4]|eukprot:XP_002897114.1 conserved hypothetical protein [Phytophthora infestans T30-4]
MIARRRRWEPASKHRPVHIYIFEKAIETLSRALLLIQVALDADLPLRQRCNLFLEIFGNSRVQERTSAYIEDQAKLLVDFVYNDRGPLAGLIDLSHLKLRTHDDLIDSFQSWFQRVTFDVDTLRDHRLRHYYEVRYDYRDNLIDWDYTMKLKKIENADVIHIRQYRDWRNSGVAFEFGDQMYTVPNRTMAAYTEAKNKHHKSVLCRGLWTDIIVSPYISFGVHCEKPNRFVEQLFEIHNKGTGVEQNRHNTVEVAVYNVLSYLYEIETGKRYQMGEVVPLTGNIEDLFSKKRYTGLFDYAFISSQQCRTLQPSEGEKHQTTAAITNILKDGAAVDIESSVFMLPLQVEQRALYVTKLQEWTAFHSLKPTFDFNGKIEPSNDDMAEIKNTVLRFIYGIKKANAVSPISQS